MALQTSQPWVEHTVQRKAYHRKAKPHQHEKQRRLSISNSGHCAQPPVTERRR